jgi:hypothetical protein
LRAGTRGNSSAASGSGTRSPPYHAIGTVTSTATFACWGGLAPTRQLTSELLAETRAKSKSLARVCPSRRAAASQEPASAREGGLGPVTEEAGQALGGVRIAPVSANTLRTRHVRRSLFSRPAREPWRRLAVQLSIPTGRRPGTRSADVPPRRPTGTRLQMASGCAWNDYASTLAGRQSRIEPGNADDRVAGGRMDQRRSSDPPPVHALLEPGVIDARQPRNPSLGPGFRGPRVSRDMPTG